MFIEILVGYQREDDDTDYDALDIEHPEDYDFDVCPTLVPIDKILRVNPCDDDQHTFILLDSGNSVRSVESYDDIKKKIKGAWTGVYYEDSINIEYLEDIVT